MKHICFIIECILKMFSYGEIPAHPFRQCIANQSNPSQQLQFSRKSCQTKPDPLHFSANNIKNK